MKKSFFESAAGIKQIIEAEQLQKVLEAPRIVHHFNYQRRHTPTKWLPSLTVPGMVMPMGEMIRRFTQGLAVMSVPVVNVDVDVSELDTMDRFQQIDLRRENLALVKKLRSEAEKGQADLVARQRKIDFDRAVQLRAEALAKGAGDGK